MIKSSWWVHKSGAVYSGIKPQDAGTFTRCTSPDVRKTAKKRILEFLCKHGSTHRDVIVAGVAMNKHTVYMAIHMLKKEGLVFNISPGVWGATDD